MPRIEILRKRLAVAYRSERAHTAAAVVATRQGSWLLQRLCKRLAMDCAVAFTPAHVVAAFTDEEGARIGSATLDAQGDGLHIQIEAVSARELAAIQRAIALQCRRAARPDQAEIEWRAS